MAWFFRSAEWLQHFYSYWKSLLPEVSATSLTMPVVNFSSEIMTRKQFLLDHKTVKLHGKFHGNQILGFFGFASLTSEKEEFLHVCCWYLRKEGTCSDCVEYWRKLVCTAQKADVSISAKKTVTTEPPLNVILGHGSLWLSIWYALLVLRAGSLISRKSWKEGHQPYSKSVFSDTYWILGAPRCHFPTWKKLAPSSLKVLREMYAYKTCIIHATYILVYF